MLLRFDEETPNVSLIVLFVYSSQHLLFPQKPKTETPQSHLCFSVQREVLQVSSQLYSVATMHSFYKSSLRETEMSNMHA